MVKHLLNYYFSLIMGFSKQQLYLFSSEFGGYNQYYQKSTQSLYIYLYVLPMLKHWK